MPPTRPILFYCPTRRRRFLGSSIIVIVCCMVGMCSAWSWRRIPQKALLSTSTSSWSTSGSSNSLGMLAAAAATRRRRRGDTTQRFGGNVASTTTSTWHGDRIPFSDHAMHVLVGEKDVPVTVEEAIGRSMQDKVVLEADSTYLPLQHNAALTPRQLLGLGGTWYLSKKDYQHNRLELPNSIYKPSRLGVENATMPLAVGDYLRIHYHPRRFPAVYKYDWKDHGGGESDNSSTLPRIIVHSSPDFWIVNKPSWIPVHSTVDNAAENVVHQLGAANPDEAYIATTQRLDGNTSGLLVVARTKDFAAYFATLLRHKTKRAERNNILKRYKCLVCLSSSQDESVVQAWQRLQGLQNKTVRHYLEPSLRAPKRFEPQIPTNDEDDDGQSPPSKDWLECLLTITNVSSIYPIPNEQHPLASQLWTSSKMPLSTKAVCEVDIQLETGRTHQIRGQLSRLGFPLVGDEQYGGAISLMDDADDDDDDNPQLLALQSSYVGFWDADYVETWNRRRRKNVTMGSVSDRWVEFTLDHAWWTPFLLEQQDGSADITSEKDAEQVQSIVASTSSKGGGDSTNERNDLLPPTVQLSPGKNKYVLVKAESQSDNDDVHWFVKSASPKECGGAYHANVAQDLVEWIHAAGFDKVTVTGGGRIDYNPTTNRAHVYGFSYGFGKGDHVKATQLIAEAGYIATYDNSNSLY